MSDHIATAACYGITRVRTGTCYFYSEEEIAEYRKKMAALGLSAAIWYRPSYLEKLKAR